MPLPSAGRPIGVPFIELQSVDSTNKYAMHVLQQGRLPGRQANELHGMAIFAHEQTAGKGQREKKWASEKDANIALSIILNPQPLSLSDQFGLSVCVAISIWEVFSKYAGDETKIKWPNDLYWRDRKAGGVLIESVVKSQESEAGSQKPKTSIWKWAIAGIGININQTTFPTELPNPVSLKQITGKDFVPLELAKEVCSVFEDNYQSLLAGNFEILFNKYQSQLYKLNKKVKLKKGNRVFETLIKGVSISGQLITRHSIEERFNSGEIEWVM